MTIDLPMDRRCKHPRHVTDRDRAMVEMRKTEKLQTVAERFGVSSPNSPPQGGAI
jgi:hypothetical protein